MTNTDFVFNLLQKKKKMAFKDIVDQLVKKNNFSFDKVGNLYADLTLDSRFVALDGNVWDLKDRHKYAETYVNVEDLQDEEEVDEFDFQIDDEDEEIISKDDLVDLSEDDEEDDEEIEEDGE